jgi:hypothetical protein
MTIAKNSKRAKVAIANAHDIRRYSLSNHFSGQPLSLAPTIWGGRIENNQYSDLIHVTQPEFLAHELHETSSAKLSLNTDGRYCLHIHSNLWYEFSTHDFTLTADDMLECSCGARRSL